MVTAPFCHLQSQAPCLITAALLSSPCTCVGMSTYNFNSKWLLFNFLPVIQPQARKQLELLCCSFTTLYTMLMGNKASYKTPFTVGPCLSLKKKVTYMCVEKIERACPHDNDGYFWKQTTDGEFSGFLSLFPNLSYNYTRFLIK